MGPQDEKLSTWRLELEHALQAGELRPENAHALMRILSPLERAVAELPEAPPCDQTQSGPVMALLWYKSHPQAADSGNVLGLIASETPVVRMLAATVLGETLEYPLADPKFLFRARTALQSQKARETSPVVNLILTEVQTRVAKMTASTRLTSPSPPPPNSSQATKVNPYNAGLPVRDKERFFGRKRILEQIGATLGSDEGVKSIVLVGARRTGKTSLLYQIAAGALGEKFIAGHVDMQALSSPDFDTLLKLILKSMLEMCARNGAPAAPVMTGNAYDAASAAIAHVCSSFPGRRVLILIDEYEVLGQIFREPQHAARLQGILENEPSVFFVFAGSQKPDSLKQSGLLALLDNSRTISISFLEPDEARQLITRQLEGYLIYPEAALASIERLCHGHPFYTQLVCQMIFDSKPGGGEVSEQDVKKVVQAFLANPSAHTILTWKGLSPQQKLAAACVASWAIGGLYIGAQQIRANLRRERYPAPPDMHQLQRGLRDLQELDILEKRSGEAVFRFTMDLLRQWIAEYRTIWDLKQEFATQYPPASLKRRVAAGAVDWAIVSAMCFALYRVAPSNWGLAIVPLLYFTVVIASAERTVGMRYFNLRVLRVDGRTLHPLRLGIVGVFAAAECVLANSVLMMLFLGFVGGRFGLSWWIWGPVLVLEGFHVGRIQVNQRHQGVWEAVVDATVVQVPEE